MGRSRSPDRSKKPRKDSGKPLAITAQSATTAGKWDEGFGGVYLPAGASVVSTNVDSNPAQSLPTVGALPLRKLTVNNIPKVKSAKDVVDEFAAAILIATNRVGVYPVVNCQFLTAIGSTRNALVEFRTPISASIALTIMQGKNGYKIKRPKDFPQDVDPKGMEEHEIPAASVEDIGGPGAVDKPASTELMTTTSSATDGAGSKIAVYGIPGNLMPEQIVRDLFSQFGKIKQMIGFTKDPVTGFIRPGVTGHIEFEAPEDALMAETTLHNFPCANSVIKISRISSAGGTISTAVAKKAVPATVVSASVTARITSNPILAAQIKQGREIGARPSLVVQLLNAVYPEDIISDSDYNEILKEVREEASKFGHVETIKMPRPTTVNSAPLGMGKIFVQFSDVTSARKFQQEMNGRTFDVTKVVCAAFYPTDRFLQGKYVLYAD